MEKIVIGENSFHATNRQIKEIKRILESDVEFLIKQVSDFEGLKFYIRDYQRGYRWTQSEVNDLLDDILSIEDDKYCMQPLVAKKVTTTVIYRYQLKVEENDCRGEQELSLQADEEVYEIVDGQQRLTTLFLLLSKLNQPKYSMHYEFFRTIDRYYLEKAIEAIEAWLNSKQEEREKTEKIEKTKQKILQNIREKVIFVWYEENKNQAEEDEGRSSEKLFKTVNSGKTPLTNAELFRAMLLNEENAIGENGIVDQDIKSQITQIAFEWDKIEHFLNDDDFWYFIANDEWGEKTRIDYLLEIYAKLKKEEVRNSKGKKGKNKELFEKIKPYYETLKESDERFSFNVVKKYVDESAQSFETISRIWEEIMDIFDKLYTWYMDNDLYHNIGFCLAVEECGRANGKTGKYIQQLLTADSKKIDDLIKKTRNDVYQYFYLSNIEFKIDDVSYSETNKNRIRACLLWFNIWTTKKNESVNMRFPFKLYKDKSKGTHLWDIEHVSARNLNNDLKGIREEDQNALIEMLKENLRILGEEFDEHLQNETFWKTYCEKVQDEDDNIRNLVLLDFQTNRSYGDDFFVEKRRKIIERDQQATYILPATRNVFLKYYSEKLQNYVVWGEDDKMAYRNKLNECFEELKQWRKD